jgi:hypothetical protein
MHKLSTTSASSALPLLLFAIFFSTTTFAQNLKLDIGINVGASQLLHATNFESSRLQNDYLVTKERVWKAFKMEYTWEDYVKGNELRTTFIQPRFGFSAHLGYRDWPIFAVVDMMSSSSSYEKIAFGGTIGMSHTFLSFEETYFLTLQGGYKFVVDKGFGANTLVNSIGDNSIRQNLKTYFDPKEPLGTNRGNLFTLRAEVGRFLATDKKIKIGLTAYGELDLTNSTARAANSRMNTIGAHVFARFVIIGARKKEDPYDRVLKEMQKNNQPAKR